MFRQNVLEFLEELAPDLRGGERINELIFAIPELSY